MKSFTEQELALLKAQEHLEESLEVHADDEILCTQIELCIGEVKTAALRMSACAYASGERLGANRCDK